MEGDEGKLCEQKSRAGVSVRDAKYFCVPSYDAAASMSSTLPPNSRSRGSSAGASQRHRRQQLLAADQFQTEFYKQLILHAATAHNTRRQQPPRSFEQPRRHRRPYHDALPASGDAGGHSTSSSSSEQEQYDMFQQYFAFFRTLHGARAETSTQTLPSPHKAAIPPRSIPQDMMNAYLQAHVRAQSTSNAHHTKCSRAATPSASTGPTTVHRTRTEAHTRTRTPASARTRSSASPEVRHTRKRVHSQIDPRDSQSPCRGSESDSDSVEPNSSDSDSSSDTVELIATASPVAAASMEEEEESPLSQPSRKRPKICSKVVISAINSVSKGGARRSPRSRVPSERCNESCEDDTPGRTSDVVSLLPQQAPPKEVQVCLSADSCLIGIIQN